MEQVILQTTFQLFTSKGIHQFTMDELANRLGVSKKTLYRFFPSRQDLVEQVSLQVSDEYEAAMQKVDEQRLNSLKTLLGYIAAVVEFCKKTSPVYFSDLRKHYPFQWMELQMQMEKTLHTRVKRVLENGISEGVFRGNLHPELVMSIWQQHLQTDFEYAAQLVNDYSKDEVFRQAMYLFLYGIIAPAAIPTLEDELLELSAQHQTAIAR